MAKANQDEFLRRATQYQAVRRERRSNPINLVRPALSAVMRHTLSGHRPLGKVARAEA
jgi:hypothetical protein